VNKYIRVKNKGFYPQQYSQLSFKEVFLEGDLHCTPYSRVIISCRWWIFMLLCWHKIDGHMDIVFPRENILGKLQHW